MGFSVPPRLRSERWALTPPFHPYPALSPGPGGIFSVALSVGEPRGHASRVYPRPNRGYAASRPAVFGLSSLPGNQEERFSARPGRALEEAPASIPAQRGRAARFTAPSASVPAGSLTGLPFRTPLRHREVDKARDRLAYPSRWTCPGIDGRLCPWLRRRPPPSSRSGPPAGVDRDEPDPKSEAKRS